MKTMYLVAVALWAWSAFAQPSDLAADFELFDSCPDPDIPAGDYEKHLLAGMQEAFQ